MRFSQKEPSWVSVLLPLWMLYAVLFVLLIQPFFNPDSAAFFLLGRLIFPIVGFGITSYLVYRAFPASSPPPRLWISSQQLEWRVLLFSIIGALCLSYLPYVVVVTFGLPQHPPPILAYGWWSVYDPLFYLGNLLILASNYIEELYFRGVLYAFLKSRTGAGIATLFTVCAFTLAHLPQYIDIGVLLIALSLFSSFLVQKYNTIFYAFIVHTLINLISYISVTRQLHWFFYESGLGVKLFLLLFAVFCISGVFLYRDALVRVFSTLATKKIARTGM
jgi:membrane protease YdiL (CAAX protease family)